MSNNLNFKIMEATKNFTALTNIVNDMFNFFVVNEQYQLHLNEQMMNRRLRKVSFTSKGERKEYEFTVAYTKLHVEQQKVWLLSADRKQDAVLSVEDFRELMIHGFVGDKRFEWWELV